MASTSASFIRGQDGSRRPRMTLADISKYKLSKPYPTDRPVVLAIRGLVLDVTSFVASHPGGSEMLYSNSGIGHVDSIPSS